MQRTADDRPGGGWTRDGGRDDRSGGPRGAGPRTGARGPGGGSSRPTGDRRGPEGRRPEREGAGRTGGGRPTGERPSRDRPAGDRPPARPGLARRPDEPRVPEGVDVRTLNRAVRAELRSLPKELEEIVAGHLVAAGELIDTDPAAAYAHAEAARRRAARLPVVREAAAETAYAAGEYAAALAEYRALRRMTGSADYLPVMADCERALGKPQQALALAREAAGLDLEPALRTEMTIVAAGARADLGQQAEAVRMLRQAVTAPAPRRTAPATGRGAAAAREQEQQAAARLRYAFADALLATGATDEARRMFAEAAARDPEQLTDAQLRADELDGLTLDIDEFDEEDDEPLEPAPSGGDDPAEDDEAEDDESVADGDDEPEDDEPEDDEPEDDEPEDDEPEDDEPEDDEPEGESVAHGDDESVAHGDDEDGADARG